MAGQFAGDLLRVKRSRAGQQLGFAILQHNGPPDLSGVSGFAVTVSHAFMDFQVWI